MSGADEAWVGLDRAEQSIDEMIERARRARQLTPARGRELSVLLVQDVGPISPFSFTQAEGTYYNGDERDLVIERLTAIVYRSLLPTDQPSDSQLTPMTRFAGSWEAGGYVAGAGGGWRLLSGMLFDFTWNMRFDDTQAQYARAPAMLSSFVLGDIRRKRVLEFARPLVVRKSASIVFQVQPTSWRNARTQLDEIIQVTFVGLGYRREPERG